MEGLDFRKKILFSVENGLQGARMQAGRLCEAATAVHVGVGEVAWVREGCGNGEKGIELKDF